MTDTFDNRLLHEFACGYYGYGNYDGAYWFIGMEEGGGDSFAGRLTAWEKRGKRELEDLAECNAGPDPTRFWGAKPKLQPTWNKLIRIVLSIEGQQVTTDQVRQYQQDRLARYNGDTCLLELLPLPSPSTADWLYARYPQFPDLASREAYRQAYLPSRIAHLRQRIHEHKPKVVVFYGATYGKHWEAITGTGFTSVDSGEMYINRSGPSIFVVTKHPAARGITNEYFHRVGEIIAAELR